VGTATAQPAQAGRCRHAVTGQISLMPSAASRKYILENTMARKLHQIWNWAVKRSSLNLFNYLAFQILWGFPPRLLQARHFSAILKTIPFNYKMRLNLAEEFCFFRIQQLTPNERRKRSLSCDERTRKRAIT